jgi:hypothetical protein
MIKKIFPTILTAIICAFFANMYLNTNACKQCIKALKVCEGTTLHQYKYEAGYFGNGKCKIECKKNKIQ